MGLLAIVIPDPNLANPTQNLKIKLAILRLDLQCIKNTLRSKVNRATG